MKDEALYIKNLELFARDNLAEAFRLQAVDCSRMKFCHTNEKELNLVDESLSEKIYLHSQSGALWEANLWAKKLPIADRNVVFIYGLGLGYYYLPLKKWLEENAKHYLVFLEDDACVLSHFLQTTMATEILENQQIIVKLLPKIEPGPAGWAKLRSTAASLFSAFAFSKPQIACLSSYFRTRFEFFHAFSLQWLNEISRSGEILNEFYPQQPLSFHNFYANMLHLGEAIPGYLLANALEGIPAVLCGAGPSLSKHLPALKKMPEQIFLMASGSAMNAVTAASIKPHVGGGIDPTLTQASRQLTSFAFNIPVFYQNYFFEQALLNWHGPLLYMPGSGNYRVSEWFEKELGMQNPKHIVMGVSTSNFLLEIANFLGCSPIVMVGMDLAYTDDTRYAKGVSVHPLDNPEQHQELERKPENLLGVVGVNGKTVYTNNQWFFESVCMGAFKEENPSVVCLNATEGGMGIPSIPNIVFADAAANYFTERLDVEGWFHGTIQNASHLKFSSEQVLEAINKWKASLQSCRHYLDLLILYFQNKVSQPQTILLSHFQLYEGKAALWQEGLFLEPVYEFLLTILNAAFNQISTLRIRNLKWSVTQAERNFGWVSLELERCRFLHGAVEEHLNSLNAGLKAFREWETALSHRKKQNGKLAAANEPLEYISKDMINRKAGQKLYFYLDGAIKAEAFFHEGKLHGPWSFFSPAGLLLFRRNYAEGLKEGKGFAYYTDGALYSVTSYSKGEAQGCHLYYYPDGVLKTEENHDKGLLEGAVRLYYPNGILKKEQHFFQGKLHGQERMWNVRGGLVMEANYDLGNAVGIAKKWDSDGKLVGKK